MYSNVLKCSNVLKSHQVDIRDKVSEEGEGYGKSPDDEPLVPPVVQVHHLTRQERVVLENVILSKEAAPFREAS